jgi:hypothetical protein
MTEKIIKIKEIEELLNAGYTIEVDSPDGFVPVSAFVDKGMWEEYVLLLNSGKVIRVNENHLFETIDGWQYAKDLVLKKQQYLTEDGYQIGIVTKTGKQIPIVDIQVEHENHRYYTDGVSSHNTGCGKSLGMCHMASAALAQGRNVLYITMEMAEEKIAERIDANLFDVRIDQLKDLTKASFNTKVKGISDKTKGKLVVKEYPTASAHVGHFRALLLELKLKKKFEPDIIYIDYLNICASSRMKGLSGSVNTYSLIKSIAEEIRGLAVEFNVPIWSATQVTRAGYSSSDIEITDTSECIAITESVTMRDGQVKTLDEVKLGDQITANDEYKTVMFKHHNKMKDCVKITTESGKSIIVSKDHVFPCKNNGNVKRISVNTGLNVSDILSVVLGKM